jgi:lysophospholipase L1-like esterase
MKRICGLLAVVAAMLVAPGGVHAQDANQIVLFEMDQAVHKPGQFGDKKTTVGTVEEVDGKFGKACKFTFVAGASGGFFTAPLRGNADWDKTAGISFWVKGDGSKSWGGVELIDRDDYGLRYAFCFPIDSTEWRKVTVPWRDVLPELSQHTVKEAKAPGDIPEFAPVPYVSTAAGQYPPSKFGNFFFGKWWYWRDYPACSYTIDRVALEKTIAMDTKDYTPAAGGVPKVLAKLKAKQPVSITVVCDSLGDKRQWANRQVVWPEVLAARLKETFGGEVKLDNAAMGGTELRQNTVLMPRVLNAADAPDLVAVWFGGNDWASGIRQEAFAESLRVAVDRIRRLTAGKSEVLLLTTCPSVGAWDTMEELAVAARKAAAEKKTGLADVAAAFHKAGEQEADRLKLYCDDKTHLGKPGHTLAAETVLQAISGAAAAAAPAAK